MAAPNPTEHNDVSKRSRIETVNKPTEQNNDTGKRSRIEILIKPTEHINDTGKRSCNETVNKPTEGYGSNLITNSMTIKNKGFCHSEEKMKYQGRNIRSQWTNPRTEESKDKIFRLPPPGNGPISQSHITDFFHRIQISHDNQILSQINSNPNNM